MATPQEEYEELKRQNRRRLVGASVMVAVAGGILAAVLHQNTKPQLSGDNVVVNTGVQPASEAAFMPLALPASDAAASESAWTAASGVQAASGAAYPQTASASAKESIQPAVAVSTPPATPPKESVNTPPPKVIEKPVAHTQPGGSDNTSPAVPAKAEPAPEAKPKPAAKRPPQTAHRQPNRAREILEGKAAKKAARHVDPEAILNGATTGAKHSAQAAAKRKPTRLSVIQVGAFTNAEKARAVQEDINGKGMQAFKSTVKTDKGEVVRIRLGPYRTREDAEGALKRLQSIGYDGKVMDR